MTLRGGEVLGRRNPLRSTWRRPHRSACFGAAATHGRWSTPSRKTALEVRVCLPSRGHGLSLCRPTRHPPSLLSRFFTLVSCVGKSAAAAVGARLRGSTLVEQRALARWQGARLRVSEGAPRCCESAAVGDRRQKRSEAATSRLGPVTIREGICQLGACPINHGAIP